MTINIIEYNRSYKGRANRVYFIDSKNEFNIKIDRDDQHK